MKMKFSFRPLPGCEVAVSLCCDSQASVLNGCVMCCLSASLHEEDANIPELRFVPAEPAHLQEQLVPRRGRLGRECRRRSLGFRTSRALCRVGTVAWRGSLKTEDVPRVLGDVCAES